jgi:ATPase subunit of ABC transporter with duplicated ATPase domains
MDAANRITTMITLKNVTLRRGAKVLLDGASVTLNPGEKVGLVGRNGAGKSSLFALLNGNLHEDAGEYYIPTQWRMGQVAQDMPETDQSATEFVVEGDTVLLAARHLKWLHPRPRTTTTAWHTPTWPCTMRASTMRLPRASPDPGPGLQNQ